MNMKIEKLSPAFKDYLWGGTKLRDVYGKKCDYEKVAESWELSTHPAGQSVIDGGEYDGLKFDESAFDEDDLTDGDIPSAGDVMDRMTVPDRKFRTSSVRFYLGFRF